MKKRIVTYLRGVLTIALAAAVLTGCGAANSGSAQTASAVVDSAAEDSAPADSQDSVADASSEDGITIGGLWGLTGFMADYEIPGSEGFELALEEINAAGGIDGKQVNYVSYDAQSDVSQATSLTTKLVEVDGANVIVGLGDPNAAIAAGTVAQDHGVPSLATTSTLPYTQDRVGDTAFLVPYGDNIQAAAVAEYAYNELGAKTAYVVTDTTDEYTLSLSKFFQSHFIALGGEVFGESTYDDNGYTDFSASIQKVKALPESPDVLFFASFTDQGPTIIKQYRDAGLDQPILSGDGLDSTEIAEIAGEAANNVYFSTHVDYTEAGDVSKFYEAYNKKYGKEPLNAFAALGYDAAYLIKYAVENYANGDYSSESVRDAIAKVTDFKGLTGTIDYSSGNVPNKTVFICRFNDGKKENLTSLVPKISADENN